MREVAKGDVIECCLIFVREGADAYSGDALGGEWTRELGGQQRVVIVVAQFSNLRDDPFYETNSLSS